MDEDLKNPVEETESEGKRLPAKDFYNKSIGRLNWPVRVLGAVIILVIAIFIGRAIHHHSKANQTASSAGTSQQTSQHQTGSKSKAAKSNSSASANKPNEVPNTGPGDVTELFVGTSALAGTGHYIINRRKNL